MRTYGIEYYEYDYINDTGLFRLLGPVHQSRNRVSPISFVFIRESDTSFIVARNNGRSVILDKETFVRINDRNEKD